MAYTVSQAYNRTLEEADKMGSDYFSLPEFLNLFQKEVWDFVRDRTKDVELTQEVTDDMRPLIERASLPLIPSTVDASDKMAAIPVDYYRRMRVNVRYNDQTLGREPQVIKHGEADFNEVSPFRKPSKEYPQITQYSDFFNVKTNISIANLIQPTQLILIYIKKPIINRNETDVIINLDDSVCELLFGRTANSFMVTKGDARAQMAFQHEETYGNKNTK